MLNRFVTIERTIKDSKRDLLLSLYDFKMVDVLGLKAYLFQKGIQFSLT